MRKLSHDDHINRYRTAPYVIDKHTSRNTSYAISKYAENEYSCTWDIENRILNFKIRISNFIRIVN